MATDEEVLKEITRAVKKYGTSRDKPPFNVEQLAIMAILDMQKPLSDKEVYDWILDNFSYYLHLLREEWWAERHGEHVLAAPLKRVFWQYEIPFKIERSEDDKPRYDITITNARQFLTSVLDIGGPAKVFPFFDLAREIRNNIYEHLFQYPKSGIMVTGRQGFTRGGWVGKKILATGRRSIQDEYSFQKWYGFPKDDPPFPHLRTRGLDRILAPLLTNRQFYREAVPFFYNQNRFCFREHKDIASTLKSLAPRRRKHLRHLSIHITRLDSAQNPARALIDLEGLRKLDIYIQRDVSERKLGEEKLPALDDVCRLRGLEVVTMGGSCENVRSRVMESALQPKDGSEVVGEVEYEDEVLKLDGYQRRGKRRPCLDMHGH